MLGRPELHGGLQLLLYLLFLKGMDYTTYQFVQIGNSYYSL